MGVAGPGVGPAGVTLLDQLGRVPSGPDGDMFHRFCTLVRNSVKWAASTGSVWAVLAPKDGVWPKPVNAVIISLTSWARIGAPRSKSVWRWMRRPMPS